MIFGLCPYNLTGMSASMYKNIDILSHMKITYKSYEKSLNSLYSSIPFILQFQRRRLRLSDFFRFDICWIEFIANFVIVTPVVHLIKSHQALPSS